MTEQPADDPIKLLLPDAEWHALWTPAALEVFVPRRGQHGDHIPMLEVHGQEANGQRVITIVALALEGFNDWATRREILRDLGVKWALDGWQVLALRFVTAAWSRSFREAENAARGNRLVETYDDKQEIMLVQGKTLDGRMAAARAAEAERPRGRQGALFDTGEAP
jgi:hypothetical protein